MSFHCLLCQSLLLNEVLIIMAFVVTLSVEYFETWVHAKSNISQTLSTFVTALLSPDIFPSDSPGTNYAIRLRLVRFCRKVALRQSRFSWGDCS